MSASQLIPANSGYAHWLRRTIHLAMVVLPCLYYGYGTRIAGAVALSREQLLWVIIGFILIFEAIRVSRGWVLIGQRDYEKHRISAVAWGAIGITITFLCAPHIGYEQAAIGAPLIWSLSIADPVMGELRRWHVARLWVALAGLCIVACVWLLSALWLGTPGWIIPIVVPMTVLAEWIKVPYVDDNALMLLIPLAAILLLL